MTKYDLKVKVDETTVYEFEDQEIDKAKDNIEKAVRNFQAKPEEYEGKTLKVELERK